VSLATWLPDALYKRIGATDPFPVELPEADFERLEASFDDRDTQLHYLHPHLPHQAWFRLPSGKAYPLFPSPFQDFIPDLPAIPLATGLPSFPTQRWTKDPNRVIHLIQRHLAHVRYTDRILGETIARLKSTGLWDRALVVITADHGIAFEPDRDSRRLTRANAAGILHVPLFVKAPGQRSGSVSDRHVQSIDVAPTVADALNIDLPWKVDGRSVLTETGADRRELVVHAIETDERLEFDAATLARELRADAARQWSLFEGDDPDRIFRSGRHAALIGRSVDELPQGPPSALRYSPAGGERFEVDPRSDMVPALIGAALIGPDASGRELAIAINGRVAGTAVSHPSKGGVRFEVLAAESFFRPGGNRLSAFEVVDGRGEPRLSAIPLDGNP
jgi:hypothetical protein